MTTDSHVPAASMRAEQHPVGIGSAHLVSAALSAIVVLAGCALMPSAQDKPPLGVSNGTTLVVTLFVNDQAVAQVPPGGPRPEIDLEGLPPLPWTVEARSPSGRVLTTMRVEPGQVWATTRPDGLLDSSGTFGRVDLSCGSLRIWAGSRSRPARRPARASPATASRKRAFERDCLVRRSSLAAKVPCPAPAGRSSGTRSGGAARRAMRPWRACCQTLSSRSPLA